MSTISAKIVPTVVMAVAIAAGSAAASSTADARTYRHYRHPYYFSYAHPYAYPRTYARARLYPDDYGSYYRGGSYSYHPEYRRAPIYNYDDSTKFSRQMVGHGDSNF